MIIFSEDCLQAASNYPWISHIAGAVAIRILDWVCSEIKNSYLQYIAPLFIRKTRRMDGPFCCNAKFIACHV